MVKIGAKDLRKLVAGRSVSVGRESVTLSVALPEDKKELEALRDEIESILVDGPEEASNPGDEEEVNEDLEDEDFEDEDEDADEDGDEEDDEDFDDEDDDDFEFEE